MSIKDSLKKYIISLSTINQSIKSCASLLSENNNCEFFIAVDRCVKKSATFCSVVLLSVIGGIIPINTSSADLSFFIFKSIFPCTVAICLALNSRSCLVMLLSLILTFGGNLRLFESLICVAIELLV